MHTDGKEWERLAQHVAFLLTNNRNRYNSWLLSTNKVDRNDHPNRVFTKDSLRGNWQKAVGQLSGSNGITTGVPIGTACGRVLRKEPFSFRTCEDEND